MRKPFFEGLQTAKCRATCASVQTNQCLCFLLDYLYWLQEKFQSIFYLVTVAEQASLCMTWLQSPKTCFLALRLIILETNRNRLSMMFKVKLYTFTPQLVDVHVHVYTLYVFSSIDGGACTDTVLSYLNISILYTVIYVRNY